jgi:hypothetical protein
LVILPADLVEPELARADTVAAAEDEQLATAEPLR